MGIVFLIARFLDGLLQIVKVPKFIGDGGAATAVLCVFLALVLFKLISSAFLLAAGLKINSGDDAMGVKFALRHWKFEKIVSILPLYGIGIFVMGAFAGVSFAIGLLLYYIFMK